MSTQDAPDFETPDLDAIGDHYAQFYGDGPGAAGLSVYTDPQGPFVPWLARSIAAVAELEPEARVVDIGAGAGVLSAAVARAAELTQPVVGIEPNPNAVALSGDRARVEIHCLDALSFAREPGDIPPADLILLAKVLHHIPVSAQTELFAALAGRLAPGGQILTVTRPQETTVPLAEPARAAFRAAQPPTDVLVEQQRAAGLEVVIHEQVFRYEVPRERWLSMIRERFWSTLIPFTDAQLEAQVEELGPQLSDPLRVEDTLRFLVAGPGQT